MKKQPLLPYTLKHGLHYVFSNSKTGKVASSNCWLTALAAVAVLNRDNTGLSSLLPQAKAKRLLTNNDLDIRVQRGGGPHRFLSTDLARRQAKAAIPILAVLWSPPPHRPTRRGDFCKWIVESLEDPQNLVHKTLENNGYQELLNKTNWRWWLARLEKMQS